MRLMPSKNGVLEKRMPIFSKRMPLHSHVLGNQSPRMSQLLQTAVSSNCPQIDCFLYNSLGMPNFCPEIDFHKGNQ